MRDPINIKIYGFQNNPNSKSKPSSFFVVEYQGYQERNPLGSIECLGMPQMATGRMIHWILRTFLRAFKSRALPAEPILLSFPLEILFQVLSHDEILSMYCIEIWLWLCGSERVRLCHLTFSYHLCRIVSRQQGVTFDNWASEIWGAKRYFLSENGEHVWGDVARLIGHQCFKQGCFTQESRCQELSLHEAVKSSAGFEAASWDWNSRGKSLRASKVLGWKAQERSLEDECLKSYAPKLPDLTCEYLWTGDVSLKLCQ